MFSETIELNFFVVVVNVVVVVVVEVIVIVVVVILDVFIPGRSRDVFFHPKPERDRNSDEVSIFNRENILQGRHREQNGGTSNYNDDNSSDNNYDDNNDNNDHNDDDDIDDNNDVTNLSARLLDWQLGRV